MNKKPILKKIERDFREKVDVQVQMKSEGENRFRVFTPFFFEDGDHLSIVLKRRKADWVLSDEGNTYMRLTYDLEENNLKDGTRHKIIANALSMFSMEDREGELVIPIQNEQYGDALSKFVQALLKISSVTKLRGI